MPRRDDLNQVLSGDGFATAHLVQALRDFAGLPGVTLEDPRLAAMALD